MKNKYVLSALLSVLLAVGASSVSAASAHFPWFHHKHSNKNVALKSKVTIEQAQAVALKKVPGTVNDSKSETVKGKEVFWFAITDAKGHKSQVWVSADSGKVTKVEKEKVAKPAKTKK